MIHLLLWWCSTDAETKGVGGYLCSVSATIGLQPSNSPYFHTQVKNPRVPEYTDSRAAAVARSSMTPHPTQPGSSRPPLLWISLMTPWGKKPPPPSKQPRLKLQIRGSPATVKLCIPFFPVPLTHPYHPWPFMLKSSARSEVNKAFVNSWCVSTSHRRPPCIALSQPAKRWPKAKVLSSDTVGPKISKLGQIIFIET